MKSRKRKQTPLRFKAPKQISRGRQNGHNVGWFFESTFRENVHLIWPVNDAQVASYLKKQFGMDYRDKSFNEAAYCLDVNSKHGTAQVLCFSEWEGDNFDLGLLAHESFHAAHNILESRGEKLNYDHSEAYAYLLQSIYDRCMQIITNKPR